MTRLQSTSTNLDDLKILRELERKILWLSCWTIHNANHLRPKDYSAVKVGGHQASSASMVSIMTALYFRILRPQDRVAVKPHASPVFHAIQYIMGNQSLENLENFRGYGGAQSYPSRTKDTDDVDFSTGSVGLGVAMTSFASIIQDYIQAKPWVDNSSKKNGRMIALVGDAELDEGNIYECLQEGWKHDLRNTWWIIDYNRQSLDGVVREGLYERIENVFRTFDWQVVTLKHGASQRSAFKEPGGNLLKDWIDNCPNQLYSALSFKGGPAWRERLLNDLGDQGAFSKLINNRSDGELADLMNNLGGHCQETIISAMEEIDHDKPVVFIAYTIKGMNTPLAGHKDNHAGLMTKSQMEQLRTAMAVRENHEWDRYEGIRFPRKRVEAFLNATPFFKDRNRRYNTTHIDIPQFPVPKDKVISTQAAFGKILGELAKSGTPFSNHIVTTSPDVTVSTNLGGWVNKRGLFSRDDISDTFLDERIPSTQKWKFSPQGQHLELGIAEMNLFILLSAAGLSHSLFGERLFPIGTLYDPFISRGLDALNYACYQDARFMVIGTPSGVSLAPEGGAHQSIASPLIGMSQDGLQSFEPAFADELAIIMQWSFDYMQKEGPVTVDPVNFLGDDSGGAVYLRLSTRDLEQPMRRENIAFPDEVIAGATWLKKPGPNSEIIIAYQGAIADEAIAVAALLAENRRDIGVLSITSADRLFTGWRSAQRERANGNIIAKSHIERLLCDLSRHCTIVTVIDGHPATLSWIGGVYGHPTINHGVEQFGQTGTVANLYRHFGIDRSSIARTTANLTPGENFGGQVL